MNITSQLFLQRHDLVYNMFLAGIFESLTEEQLRLRPHPRLNPISWIIWHMVRAEDSGLNRFVVDRPQVLDEGDWMRKMDLPWRHNGGGMDSAGVEELGRRVDLKALLDYSMAVCRRTGEIVTAIDQIDLEAIPEPEHIRTVLVDEGLAYSSPEDLVRNYTGWSKGRYLMTLGLTHPFQHIGEIDTLASLLGVDF